MPFKRFQNIAAESRWILPFAAITMAAAVYFVGAVEQMMWIQTLCLALTAFLQYQVNKSNQLLRIHSHMVPATYLLLASTAIILLPNIRYVIVSLCTISLYATLFRCYQLRNSSGWVFYGFLCLGMASMVFVQILYFVPLLWVMMAINLYTLRLRSWFASILGLLTPYWFAAAYYMYSGDVSMLLDNIRDITHFGPLFHYQVLSEHQLVSAGFLALLSLMSIVHYIRHGYADKIRTRMFFQLLMAMDIACWLFMALQPQHFAPLMAIATVTTAPLAAHFLTLTHTWVTNIVFYLFLLLTLAITSYHLWIPSLSSWLATVM